MTIKKLVREIPIRKSERQHIMAIVKPLEKDGFFCETTCKGISVYAIEEVTVAIT